MVRKVPRKSPGSTQTHGSYSLDPAQTHAPLKAWNKVPSRCSLIGREHTYFPLSIPVSFLGCVDTKEADIYFLIDGSSSILKKQFEQIQIFMSSVIDMFPIGPDKVRVGVVQYSHKNEEEFPISLYMDGTALKKAVFNIKQLKGRTFTGKALDFILPIIKKGKSERADDTPCYLIVLTDGKSEDGVLEPANRLRAEHVTIHAVGIGEANKTQLQQIAGNDERVNFGQNFDSLKNIKNEIVHRICSEKGKKTKMKLRKGCINVTRERKCSSVVERLSKMDEPQPCKAKQNQSQALQKVAEVLTGGERKRCKICVTFLSYRGLNPISK